MKAKPPKGHRRMWSAEQPTRLAAHTCPSSWSKTWRPGACGWFGDSAGVFRCQLRDPKTQDGNKELALDPFGGTYSPPHVFSRTSPYIPPRYSKKQLVDVDEWALQGGRAARSSLRATVIKSNGPATTTAKITDCQGCPANMVLMPARRATKGKKTCSP